MESNTPLYIKNWREYQHYKDRNPQWVKLHSALLTSEDWVTLDDHGRVAMIACMLVAARTDDGQIPNNPIYIQRVAYLTKPPNLKQLLECGFLCEHPPVDSEKATTARERVGWGSRHIPNAVKATVWQRDKGKCVVCKAKENIEYDHIVPISKGGESVENNLQLLCRSCNRKKRTQTTRYATDNSAHAQTVATHAQTVATHAQHNQNMRRPEERRGETEQSRGDSCAEPPSSPPDDDPVVMTFDCVGGSWPLHQSKIEQWRDTYGEHCDVEFEIRKAQQWLNDNPARRKTPQGMTRFLGDWIQRTVNRGPYTPKHPSSGGHSTADEARIARVFGHARN